MKTLKSYILGFAAMAALSVGFTACQDDIDAPSIDVPVASLTPNTTLLELKEQFYNAENNYAMTIEDENDPEHRYIIHGNVISSDEEGNVFKTLVIQDETCALSFSIDRYNLYLNYRPGQEIVMDVTGLTIGKYAGLQQIGSKSWYENGNTWQVSFMAPAFFEERAELNGEPTLSNIDTLAVNAFSELNRLPAHLTGKVENATADIITASWQSQLVRLRNVTFQEAGERPLSTYHNTENATMVDQTGNTMILRTSGYSTFYSMLIPEGTVDVVGILGYFNGTWQVLLIDGDGIIPASTKGDLDDPYTVEEAIAEANGYTDAWVSGYIVGALQPEVTEVTSNDDIQWEAPTILGNNIVIADAPAVKDYTKCMVVPLASGSDFQVYGNLRDHAENIGKAIKVKGKFDQDYAMAAVTNNTGAKGSFEIEGVEIPDTPVEPGAGATILASQLSVDAPTTIDGYTITIEKGSGATAPAFHANTSAIRLYNGNTINFSGAGMKTIKFTLASDAGFRYTTVQCSTGSISPAQAMGDTEFTWVGEADNVTFTVDTNATLGSDGEGSRGQIRFTQIDINGGKNGEEPNPPTPPTPGEEGPALTVAATALSVTEPTTVSAYTFTFSQGSGVTAPAQHANTSAIRLYNGNTLNIKGAGMKTIKFTLASDAGFRYTTVQCSTGSISPAQAMGDTEFTWVGDATDVTFTVDANATLGSDGEGARGQIRFTTIDINGGGNGEDPNPPTPPTPPTPGGEGAGATIAATALSVTEPTTIDGYTFTFSKGAGTTAPAQHANTSAIRLYNGNTLNITGGTMKTIKFTLASDAGFRYTTVQCSTGSISPAQAMGDTEFTWVGDAADVTFTVDANATLGSDGEGARGQIRFTTIDINGGSNGGSTGGGTTGGGDEPNPPTPPTPSGDKVSIAATSLTLPGSTTVGGYTINIQQASGATAPALNGSEARTYADNTITISGAAMTKIVFTIAASNSYRYTTLTPSTGEISPAQAVGDTSVTWIGNATEVTFTVGHDATLGSDGASKRGQIRFTQLDITASK